MCSNTNSGKSSRGYGLNMTDTRLREIVLGAAKVGPKVDWCLQEAERLHLIDRNMGLLSSTNDEDVSNALQYLADLAKKAAEQIKLMSHLDKDFPCSLYETEFATFSGIVALHVSELLESPTHYQKAKETFDLVNAVDLGNGGISFFHDENHDDSRPISRFGVIMRNGELERHITLLDSPITADQMTALLYLKDFAQDEIDNLEEETDPKMADELPLVCGSAIGKIRRLMDNSDNSTDDKLLYQADRTQTLLQRVIGRRGEWHDYPAY